MSSVGTGPFPPLKRFTVILLKPIITDAEKASHQENYLINSGGKVLSTTYLEASSNFTFTSIFAKRSFGGVSINTKGPFRVEKALGSPLDDRQRFLEISGLWIEPSCRTTTIKTLVMIVLMLAVARFEQKQIIAYTTQERLWNKLYARLGAEIIYRGPLQGLPDAPSGYVFTLNPRSIYTHWPSYILGQQ